MTYPCIGGPLDGYRRELNFAVRKGDRIWFGYISKEGRRQQVGYDFNGKRLIYGETREMVDLRHPRFIELADQIENHSRIMSRLMEELTSTFLPPLGEVWALKDHRPHLVPK